MSQRKLCSMTLALLLIAASGCLSIAISSGLGTDIVMGPTGPSGADRDGAFRSLAVHPTDEDIYLALEKVEEGVRKKEVAALKKLAEPTKKK